MCFVWPSGTYNDQTVGSFLVLTVVCFKFSNKFSILCSSLDNLSPLRVLARGYSMVKKNNSVISSVEDIGNDDEIEIKFSNGSAKAQIIEVLK